MTNTPVLTIRNLTKKFGGLTAVDNVDMQVFPGEVVALLGDNGAGKSTLIKCVSGAHAHTRGTITFQGEEVNFATPIEARDKGIETIYQDLALANNLDVSGNIFLGREKVNRHFGGLVKSLDDKFMRARSGEALETLHVKVPSLKAPIETLSGGQRQAVAIARAVYWDARLMIMDEPTNNLGVPEQKKVLELIRQLRDRGVPVVLISHNLPDVFEVADRLIVMHRGRKVTEKKVSETTSEEVVQYMVGALDDTRPDKVAG
jgi:ribose transport system ATP-binding protein